MEVPRPPAEGPSVAAKAAVASLALKAVADRPAPAPLSVSKRSRSAETYARDRAALRYVPSELFAPFFDQLRALLIPHNRLRSIHARVLELRQLRRLDLGHNEIGEVPARISVLEHLQDLELGHNLIAALPPELFLMAPLQLVDLSANRLTALPAAVSALEGLRSVALGRNPLASLAPEIEMLTSLTHLDVSHTGISQISLPRSAHMRLLHLQGNRFASLPSMHLFTALHELDCSHNELTVIPSEVTTFTCLRVLDLSFNKLTALPVELAKLLSLERLYLEANMIEYVPPELGHLKRLRELVVFRNRISEVPRSLGQLPLTAITYKSFEENPLRESLAVIEAQLREERYRLETLLAEKIQRIYRSYILRKKFKNVVRRILALQTQQKLLSNYKKEQDYKRAILMIQAFVRSWILRRKWRNLVKGAKVEPRIKTDSELREEELLKIATRGYCFGEPDNEKNCQFSSLDSNDGGMLLKSATVEKVVEKLTSDDYKEPNYMRTVLLTHHSFISSEMFLQLLIIRYNLPHPPNAPPEWKQRVLLPHHQRVLAVLKCWIYEFYSDFLDDRRLLERLHKFINWPLLVDYKEVADDFTKELSKATLKNDDTKGEDLFEILANMPETIMPKDASRAKLVDWEPEEVARQLTLIEFGLFRRIKWKELLDQNWNKKKKQAPNVVYMIERFNQASGWVALEIVGTEKAQARTKKIAWFLQVAQKCRELNNYHSLMYILVGLTNAAVSRLKLAWEALPSNAKKISEDLNALMAMPANYKIYRAALAQTKQPCLPFLGLSLSDVTFMDDGNPNKVDNIINWTKRRGMAKLILELLKYQTPIYGYETIPILQEQLLKVTMMRDKELFDMSLLREPRGKTNEGFGSMLKRKLSLYASSDQDKDKRSAEVNKANASMLAMRERAKSIEAPAKKEPDRKISLMSTASMELKPLEKTNSIEKVENLSLTRKATKPEDGQEKRDLREKEKEKTIKPSEGMPPVAKGDGLTESPKGGRTSLLSGSVSRERHSSTPPPKSVSEYHHSPSSPARTAAVASTSPSSSPGWGSLKNKLLTSASNPNSPVISDRKDSDKNDSDRKDPDQKDSVKRDSSRRNTSSILPSVSGSKITSPSSPARSSKLGLIAMEATRKEKKGKEERASETNGDKKEKKEKSDKKERKEKSVGQKDKKEQKKEKEVVDDRAEEERKEKAKEKKKDRSSRIVRVVTNEEVEEANKAKNEQESAKKKEDEIKKESNDEEVRRQRRIQRRESRKVILEESKKTLSQYDEPAKEKELR